MAEKKLGSFKAADLQASKRQRGAAADAKNGKKAEAARATMGFERIEALLDREVPGDVGQKMANLLDSLTELEGSSKTQKAKAGAKKARVAVERTIDLLDHLYQTKETLVQKALSSRK